MIKNFYPALSTLLIALTLGCSNPQPGPDKTVAGAVLGAGWGAGAGAVVGNQISNTGEGVAVGAGLGAGAGMLTGMGYDLAEGASLNNERELASLKMKSAANQRELESVQAQLDRPGTVASIGGVYQVFFDEDTTSLRAGAIANLEVIAESLKANPHASTINVVGHADDSGTPEYNERLAEARARSVFSYLAARGIGSDQIKVTSFGSKRPIASNTSSVGRQLNRRVDVYIGN